MKEHLEGQWLIVYLDFPGLNILDWHKAYAKYLLKKAPWKIFFIVESQRTIEAFYSEFEGVEINICNINEIVTDKSSIKSLDVAAFHERYPSFKKKVLLKKFKCSGQPFGMKKEVWCLCIGLFFETLLKDTDVVGFVAGIGMAFRSLEVKICEMVAKNYSVPFFFPSKKPFRGRFHIYNNMEFSFSKHKEIYDKALKRKIDDDRFDIDQYIKEYKLFKQKTDQPSIYQKASSRRNIGWSDFIFSNPREIINRIRTIPYKILPPPMYKGNGDFVLFVLNKTNNWIQNMTQKEPNLPSIVEEIHKGLPDNISLVIAENQLVHFPSLERAELYKTIKRLSNTYFSPPLDDTLGLIQLSSLVINISSTAGIEALLYGKPLVIVGKNPIFFGMNDPPAEFVENQNELSEVVKRTLLNGVNVKHVKAYFQMLLEISCNYDGKKDMLPILSMPSMETYPAALADAVIDAVSKANS